jgi:putative transferase (TIGR04331 family)
MFLATTANQKLWKPDEPILFLGEWCRVYSQKHVWSELEHEVLPYHGLGRDALYKDYIYAMNIYERNLIQLTDSLNVLHGSNHSVRYWRIILGPWLIYFIQILLDRYRSICVAIDSGKVTNTWITTEFPEGYLPNDFSGFRDRYLHDNYNHCLFSQIIRSLEAIPWEIKNNTEVLTFERKGASAQHREGFKWVLIRLLSAYSRFIPDSLQKMVAHQSYIKPMDLARLQLSMKMLPCPYRPQVDVVFSKVDWEMRQSIKLEPGENRFESILKECIPLHIPKICVEGYSSMVQRVEEFYPKKTKAILTSNAYKLDEGFKFWTAGQVDQGVKLAVTQHGGHVGDGLWSTDDDHEIRIADRYFTWGWTRENEGKVVPMSSSMLGRRKDCLPDPSGPILCVSPSFPRYPYQMFSVPLGPLVLETIKFQKSFLQIVSPEVSNLLVFRLDKNRGWEEKLRWRDSDVSPKVYQGNSTYFDHLSMSRLCICFYNGTPFLETFASNYPTLLCWDPKFTELNESALPYFNLLREAGILHDIPETLVSKLNEIYENPVSWWMSTKVQDAKNQFCDQYARTTNDWLADWKEEISKLTDE